MTKEDAQKHAATLAQRAAESHSCDDALKFSQAACNVANAYSALVHAEPAPMP